jgi:hypothetical protein
MKFWVHGNGFSYTSKSGAALFVGHGVIFDTADAARDVPAGWTPGPDTYNLWPMDAAAQSALVAAVNAQLAKTPPPVFGLTECNPNVQIYTP